MTDLTPHAIRQLLMREQPVVDRGGPELELGSAEEVVRAYMRMQPAPFVPEYPPPYWTFIWPGSQALAEPPGSDRRRAR